MPHSQRVLALGDSMHTYTRSLRRRFVATLIDFLCMAAFAFAILAPIALYSGKTIISGVSFFHFNTCTRGTAINFDGKPLSTEGWQGLIICDYVSDFVFKRRTASFVRQSETVSTTGTKMTIKEFVTLDIDKENKVTRPIDITTWSWLFFIGLLAFFEHRFQATPGKKLMSLEVFDLSDQAPSLGKALSRNILKLLPIVLLLILPSLLANFGWAIDPLSTITPDNKVLLPKAVWDYWWISIAFTLAASLLSLVMVFSILLPWSRAGRGLYDRVARTQVLRV
jgi:uncharacterized RDD family membrane protein YckC